MRRRKLPPPPPKPSTPPLDACYIPHDEERMDAACDSCGKRFNVPAAKLRCDGELELPCPYRKMLIQHVEYACVMVIE